MSIWYADHTDWNHKQNQFITLLISSNNMDFVEKHVTSQEKKELIFQLQFL